MRTVKFAFALYLAMITTVASPAQSTKLTPPAAGKIEVAVAISDGAVMIDFGGPWEVFSDVMLHTKGQAHQQLHPFHLYTVAENAKIIRTSGGMQVVPDYTFENAPKPNIVIVPAQGNDSPKMMAWIRKMSQESDVLMSVCTGALLLAKSGVLDGKSATTHHEAYATMEHAYPKISVQKRMRYVQSDPVIFTAGGLSSGIDLALHVVELYYGREVTDETVQHLEYEGTGWSGSGAASIDFTKPAKAGLSATLDNLSNNTFENPSTEFSRKGETVEFSFAGDPAYKGALTEDGNTIEGTLYMSDGSTANLKWTRSKALTTDNGTIVAKNLPITGSWNGTLDVSGIRTNFVLHIQE
jgi:putative intracellular protease/amidase